MLCRQCPTLVGVLVLLSAAWLPETSHAAGAITSVPPASGPAMAVAASGAATLLLRADAPAQRIDLAAQRAAETATVKAFNADGAKSGATKGRPLTLGYGRDIPASRRAVRASDLTWVATGDGGRAARITVRSPDAHALRVALSMANADPDVTIRFAGAAQASATFGPFPAREVAAESARSELFWSPVLEGDTAIIELHAPAGVAVDGIAFDLVRVSHLLVAPDELGSLSSKRASEIGLAGSCNIDLACVVPATTALTDVAKAVVKIVFVYNSGQTAACSGTLLNDSTQSSTPYIFTGAHCMNSATAARTANTYWFFDAIACKSKAVPPFVQLSAGATLLGQSPDADWALIRLNQPAPGGSTFAGWRAEPIPPGALISVLHHPQGDLKKWSQGTFVASSLQEEFDHYGNFGEVRYTQGTTEGGSSGSGLLTFLAAGGYYEVRGGLSYGSASCSFPADPDYYTELAAGLPVLRQYLTPDSPNPTGQAVATEFYNRTLDHYFISTNPVEINNLDTGATVGWERTGLRFLAYNNPQPGTFPVCRFYRAPGFGDSHFYSADPAECAEVVNRPDKFPGWIYESAAVFYVQRPDFSTGACPVATRPVYRFYNSSTVNHRYPAEVAVRNQLAVAPYWTAEGYGAGPYFPVMCAAAQ